MLCVYSLVAFSLEITFIIHAVQCSPSGFWKTSYLAFSGGMILAPPSPCIRLSTQQVLLGPTQVFADSAKIPEYRVSIRNYLRPPKLTFVNVLRSKIEMWYLHGPDRTTPYEVTLKAVNDLYKEGYVNRSAGEYMRC